MARRFILWAAVAVVVAVLAIQLVPYGRNHTDPPVGAEPKWDTLQTRQLAARACFDCHSNETVWPWYSDVAPLSWLIQRDVDRGRRSLNFSTMDRRQGEVGGAARTMQRGTMPPSYYVLLHPTAALSATEKDSLIQGLQATLGTSAPGTGERESGGDRERGN